MSTIDRKIELTANILIIVVAILVVGFLAQRYFYPTSPTPPPPKSPAIGDRVLLADFDWSKSNKNVLLVLQKGCRFCAESAEFYKRLIQQARDKNVNVVAVLPQSRDEAEKYLNDLSLSGIQVRQSPLGALNVGGTPTIIIADDRGKITDLWLGKLSPAKETEVLAKLST
jgi:thioredoxin-related protein